MGQQEEKTMNGFDDEVEAARRLLELRNERSGDFKFHKTDRPVMRCSDGHCVSAYDVEVTTKRRGVKIAAYVGGQEPSWLQRSEEHTSELQSLMCISYAVFCLKKKIQYISTQQTTK